MMSIPPRRLALLDAPSNLGLRPPREGVTPGVCKLAGSLRDCGLLHRLGAEEGGVLTPPRYLPDWVLGTVRTLLRVLADRVGVILRRDAWPIVLGGDCSILLGNGLALNRIGRHGLAFIDGHLDFRHPGNSEGVGAAAGEDLALATGRGDRLAGLGEGRRVQKLGR